MELNIRFSGLCLFVDLTSESKNGLVIFPRASSVNRLKHVPMLAIDSKHIDPKSSVPDFSAAIDIDDGPVEFYFWNLTGYQLRFLGKATQFQNFTVENGQGLLDLSSEPHGLKFKGSSSSFVPSRSAVAATLRLPAGPVKVIQDAEAVFYGYTAKRKHVPATESHTVAHTVEYSTIFEDPKNGGPLKLQLKPLTGRGPAHAIALKQDPVLTKPHLRIASFCSSQECLRSARKPSRAFLDALQASPSAIPVESLTPEFIDSSEVLDDFAAHYDFARGATIKDPLLPVIGPPVGPRPAEPSVRCKEGMARIQS